MDNVIQNKNSPTSGILNITPTTPLAKGTKYISYTQMPTDTVQD